MSTVAVREGDVYMGVLVLMAAALTDILGVVGVGGVVATVDGLLVTTPEFLGKACVRTGGCCKLDGMVEEALDTAGATAGTMALVVGAAEPTKAAGVIADVVTTGATALAGVFTVDVG